MSMTLHCAKTFKVEWEDREHFNWQIEEIESLLKALGMSLGLYNCQDTFDYPYSDTFDVDREDYLNGLKNLESYINGTLEDEDMKEEIEDALQELKGWQPSQILDILTKFEEESDHTSEWLHFAFF